MLTLNNQSLMLMTQFALANKDFIGDVKVTEMFRNVHYTFDVLVKALLTGDRKLAELTKKISYEFEIGFNLITAIESYIYNINDINGNDAFIHKSKHLLTVFAKQLYGIQNNEASYRQATEKLLLNVDNNEKTFSIILAKKFYLYWRASNRPLAECNKNETLKQIDKKKAFNYLWKNIDKEFFSHLEMCVIMHYAECINDKCFSELDSVNSVRIAKLITYELRNEPTNSDETYRDAILRVEFLFEKVELKKLFLNVSRDFYYFWIGNIPKRVGVM